MAAIVLLIGVSLNLSVPAEADPYGPNHGAAAVVTTTSLRTITNIDGIYDIATITSNMDVPLSGGSPSVYPGTQAVIGSNVRPMQISARNPPSARDQGEFLAIGYAAGCAYHPDFGYRCTGIHPTNGGVYKRWYFDGRNCYISCRNFLEHRDAISAGENRYFQIQRKWSDDIGFHWRLYFHND